MYGESGTIPLSLSAPPDVSIAAAADDDGTPVKELHLNLDKGPVKDILGFLKTELG